jgi:hypothetical protein
VEVEVEVEMRCNGNGNGKWRQERLVKAYPWIYSGSEGESGCT